MMTAFIFLCTDLLLHKTFQIPTTLLLWSWYSYATFTLSPILALGGCMLLLAQSTIQYGIKMPIWLAIIFLYLLGRYGRSLINSSSCLPYSLAFTVSSGLLFLTRLLGAPFYWPTFNFTFLLFFGNIIVTIILLKFFFQGRLSSR